MRYSAYDLPSYAYKALHISLVLLMILKHCSCQYSTAVVIIALLLSP